MSSQNNYLGGHVVHMNRGVGCPRHFNSMINTMCKLHGLNGYMWTELEKHCFGKNQPHSIMSILFISRYSHYNSTNGEECTQTLASRTYVWTGGRPWVLKPFSSGRLRILGSPSMVFSH